MADATILNVGEKLIVGQIDTSFLTAGSKFLPGTTVLNGAVFIGATPQIGIARATCMIGPPFPNLSAPASLEVVGISNFLGVNNVFGVDNIFGLLFTSGETLTLGIEDVIGLSFIEGTLDVIGVIFTDEIIVYGAAEASYIICGDLTCPNVPSLVGKSAYWDAKKPFDILHPTKEGHRLRYVCLEGPSAEVYVRGILKDSNIIELPDYWKGLVDEETIGVTLTPIGNYQELFWEKIEWGSRIIVKNNSSSAINCHYVVYGERKDTSKNIPEYKGLTPMDYPGDNREYNLNR